MLYKMVHGVAEVVQDKRCLWWTTNPAPKNSGLYFEDMRTTPYTDKRRVRFECVVDDSLIERWDVPAKKWMEKFMYDFLLTHEENTEWYVSFNNHSINNVSNVHVDGMLLEDPKNEIIVF